VGKHDSTRTRVAPVFTMLMDRDCTGVTWLLPLLKLGSRSAGRCDSFAAAALLPQHPRWWGKNERRLAPPVSLLRWLIRNASAPESNRPWGSEQTRTKRQRLVERDAEVIEEALLLLDRSVPLRAWYVLEGMSQPDVVLETAGFIVVIEGKRKEPKATTVTTWMRSRNQMLRHMDAAWEMRGERDVFGLMIVEGDKGAAGIEPNHHWIEQASLCLSPEAQAASLPHREPAERARIAEGFLGVTTWQRLCQAFQLEWPPVEDA
jgi:hypothetical protein